MSKFKDSGGSESGMAKKQQGGLCAGAESIRSWVQRGNDASECGFHRPRRPFGF